MHYQNSKVWCLWASILGAVLWLLTAPVFALVCPSASAVQYNQAQARFVATSQDGTPLRSRVTPVFMPVPGLVAISITPPSGQQTGSCWYHYSGNTLNVVVLLPYS